MTELERFNDVWHFIKQRGEVTQNEYENILFSIWKHHPDWHENKPIQINCYRNSKLYRVVKRAEDAGLLIKVGNYSVGNRDRLYHKNQPLFDTVFRNAENKYKIWLDSYKNNKDKDIILKFRLSKFNKQSLNKDINIPYVSDSSKKIKRKELNYDLQKLYELSKTMIPHYNNLIEIMNDSVENEEFKFYAGKLHFDNDGLPTGRPYSYFCSTLNPKKKHKDNSLETRPDFLNRIGLSDYYEVYDIKSEIPRINWLFNTGEWKSDNYDFYTEIIKDTDMMEYLEYEIERGETQYTEYEDSLKQLFMRIYFGKGSDAQSYSGYYNGKLNRRPELKGNYYIFKALQNDYIETLDIWKVICNSTRKICGAPIGNLIFWFAFFIETEVKIELLNRGKKVYNIYDGFYFNQDIRDEIIELLDVKSKYVYDKYMKIIKI